MSGRVSTAEFQKDGATVEPTAVVGDLLRTSATTSGYGSVRVPVGAPLADAVARYAAAAGCGTHPIRAASAIVALAAFSGRRDLRVGFRTGAAATEVSLRLVLTEVDSLRTLVARIPGGPTADAEPVSEDLRCLIAPAGDPPAPRYELGVFLAEAGVEISFDTMLFESATAEQLARYVVAALTALLDAPDRPVAQRLRPTFAEALGWLVPPAPDPGELPLPGDAVRRWIRETPNAEAIVAPDHPTLTYAQLGATAGALGDAIGDEPGGPVAILTADSRFAAIAMVACQLLDRCHVFLDPEVPVVRNAALVSAVGAGLLVHEAESGDAVAAAAGIPVLDAGLAARPSGTTGAIRSRPADLRPAYLAFTSGTTGAPKAIVQSRRGFAQFLDWQRDELGLGPGSRVANSSAPVFDACYMEVFGALAFGATLHVPAAGQRRNPAVIAAWLAASGITFFQGVPSFVEYVVAELEAATATAPDVENVIVAGEVLPPALCGRMRAVFPNARLHNMFGPTECVLATRHEIAADHSRHRRVPIGRPITGRRLVLLDPEGRPVPHGAVGEIGIVSRFLTLGYAGDEAQTAERYRPVPGSSEERIYHTGDFGRIGADGELRYLGRRDGQVKVRGIRINLDEVETALAALPGAGRCKVVDVRVPAGHLQLVAFVEVSGATAPVAYADRELVASWRRGIAEALGPRVVPARFLVVAALPTTATGKPDLRRLRELDAQLRAGSAPGPGPDTVHTDRLDTVRRTVWTVLGRRTDDEEDLLARAERPMLLAIRIKKALQQALPGVFDLIDIRAHRSVCALAAAALDTKGPATP